MIHRFDFHQAGFAVLCTQHGPQIQSGADLAEALKISQFFGGGGALHAADGDVAAQDAPAMYGQTIAKRLRQQGDAGKGGDTQSHATDQNTETAQTSAQIADHQGP